MKLLIVLALCAAIAVAKPVDQTVSVTQDTLGNYKLAVDLNGSARVEQGNADGSVSGSYSYIDSNGQTVLVEYTAGPDGFRATGNNIPVAPIDTNVPVQETAEVAAARAIHLAALASA